MAERKGPRGFEQLQDDRIWPGGGLGGPHPDDSIRHMAVFKVLCRIPEDGYQTLVAAVDDFHWFIPEEWNNAGVFPFPWTVIEKGRRSYAKVVYLSPTLERRSFDVVVGIVAHELAHISLGHRSLSRSKEDYDANEEAAKALVRKWGFGHEERKHAAVCKRLEKRWKV